MALREAIFRNLGWKVLALFLGVLVWYFVNAGMQGRFTPFARGSTAVFEVPVYVLISGQIPIVFEVSPPKVTVTVQGRRDVLQNLTQSDIVAFVNLSDVYAATEVQRPVRVKLRWEGPEVSITPATVRVLLLHESGVDNPPRLELKLTP